tara:strand:- start:353 stop:805 length:453 start_codon:yes stop_codon:yes gene_type:complete
MAFKMKGPSLYKGTSGMGVKGAIKNQKDYAGQADGRATSSPFQHPDTVEEGSNKDAGHAAKHNKKHTDGWTHGKVGSEDNKWTPPVDKKTPLEQRVTKGGEGQDENKIFDKDGNHVGDWVDGKKVMKKQAFSKKKGELKRTLTSNIKTKK